MTAIRPEFKAMNHKDLVNTLPITRHRAEVIDELVIRVTAISKQEDFSEGLLALLSAEKSIPKLVGVIGSEPRKTLREELTAIVNSGWDYTGMHIPEEGREFCTEEGHVLDKTEDQLTEQQKRFLGTMRSKYRRWCYSLPQRVNRV
jgi:hypothetical protein